MAAFRTFGILAACATLVVPVGALTAEDDLPDLNRRVVAFAKTRMGKKVGNGECTTFAFQALKSAGARARPIHHDDDGNYIWGHPVASFREALPGDIVQFRDAVFRGKRYVSSRRWVSWHDEYPHHTALVASVREHGRVVALWHQNVGPADDEAARKIVTESLVRPESLQKGGKFWIYRPVARETPPD